VSALAEDVKYGGGGATVQETKPLWDMPALYLAIVALVSAEWAYRKAEASRDARSAASLLCRDAFSRRGRAPAGAEQSHLVIVVGLGGEPKYTRGLPRARRHHDPGRGEEDGRRRREHHLSRGEGGPARGARVQGPRLAEAVQKALGTIAQTAAPAISCSSCSSATAGPRLASPASTCPART
jgi:hypothetical protein